MPEVTWTGSLHQTFRLLPAANRSGNLIPFLGSDGLTAEDVLRKLPYDSARSQNVPGDLPDAKRFRDGKQVYQTAGLLYEGEDRSVHVTELGRATLRWLDILSSQNAVILGRHAAYALAACQLRNPTGSGSRYDPSMAVFPFRFIWQAMLRLDGKISSDELNRAIFRTTNDDDLERAVENIARARVSGNINDLGTELLSGPAKNDRIIPWMSLASFGWILFPDKRGGASSEYYQLNGPAYGIVREAAQIRHRHRSFSTVAEYVEYLSDCAALPKDFR